MHDENHYTNVIAIEDLLDWAYCPLVVWWKKKNNLSMFVSSGNKISGERLMKQSVRKSIESYVKAKEANNNDAEITLEVVFKFVWKQWLESRGLKDLFPSLVKYAKNRQAVIEMGKYQNVKEDGKYGTSNWKNESIETSLLALKNFIDANNDQAGIATLILPDETYIPAMGLAEAYFQSSYIIEKLSESFPPVNSILGVYKEVYVDLLSVRITATADLILDVGEAPRLVGRPAKDAGEKYNRRSVTYEFHHYDETIPSINDLGNNLKLSILRSALPKGITNAEYFVDNIFVRHMRSGMGQPFPKLKDNNAIIIESLAKSYLNASRSGIVIPRMIAGWRACQDCSNRFLCFSDEGVMESLNPPLIEQTDNAIKAISDIRTLTHSQRNMPANEVVSMLKKFYEIQQQYLNITPEGFARILETCEAEIGEK